MNTYMSYFFHNTVQRIRGWDYKMALSQLECSQWQAPEVIKEQRLMALRSLINHCYTNVPYYRTLWKKIDFSPGDITKEEDISSLPIISKDTLQSNYTDFISEIGPDYEIWKSSGSTGEPFPFCLDKNTIKYNTFGSLARGRRWWGFEYGQPEGMIWSGVSDVSGTFTGRMEAFKRKFSWGLKNIKLIDVYNIDRKNAAKGYKLFKKHRPVLIRAISSGLYRFCAEIEQLGLDGKLLGIKGAIYTGEGLPTAQRIFVEKVLGCPSICEYGCTELGIIGFECPSRNIHLSHDNLILEFLSNGSPAKPEEVGELIVTNLRNYAAPLIRYSVGDFVTKSTSTCECGRTLPIIKNIQGRLHDTVVTPDGTAIHGLFFTHLFDTYDQVHQFRVVQEDINHLHIELVAPQQLSSDITEKLKNIVSKKFGPQVIVSITQVSSLPISSRGKTPWIISNVDNT